MRELVLFSHQYPYKVGDASFIRNEIDDLASAFDKIYIVVLGCYDSEEVYTLPDNVELLFSGFKGKKDIIVKGLLNTSSVVPVVKLLCQDMLHMKRPQHFKHFLLACFIGRGLSSLPQLRRLLNKEDVSFYFFWGFWGSYLIPWLRRAQHVTVRFHRGDLYLEKQGGYLPFRQSIFTRANVLAPISNDGERYLAKQLEHFQIKPSKLRTLKLGTRDYGLSPQSTSGDITIVSCSSLISLKRVSLIYQVVSSFALQNPSLNVHWYHFGSGKSNEVSQLEKTVLENKSDNLTASLKGYVDSPALMEFYRKTPVDLFVNLSTSEGIPVSIMEAASFNIPVIATDVGGTSELVGMEHGTGMLVKVEDSVDEIVQQIELLLSHKNNYHPRDFWEKMHNQEICNQTLIQLLKEETL